MASRTTSKRTTKSPSRSTHSRSAHSRSTQSRSSRSRSTTPPSRRWSAKVTTDSTHPDEGLFLKSAPQIARALASKRVSPKGPTSGMRMLNFYINRAGKNLSAEQHANLERAKELLSEYIARHKGRSKRQTSSKSSSSSRRTASRSR
jgi:hypothetical protein